MPSSNQYAHILHSIRTKPQNLNTLISFTIIITTNAKRDRWKQNTTLGGNDICIRLSFYLLRPNESSENTQPSKKTDAEIKLIKY